MPLLLIVLFIVLPIVELYVIIQVGQAIGVWWTILLLIADSVLGSMLMRAQGRAAWRRFNEALRAGRVPAREVFDGALVIFGGAFLLTPGFVTDVLGVGLLLPPTRALVRRSLVKAFAGRVTVAAAAPGMMGARRRSYPTGADPDVEGTASEIDRDPPRLP